MDDFSLHRWFERDELDACPACGEQASIQLPASGSAICLACGSVTIAADTPQDDSRDP
jgi:hypothetical protein